jgi:murein DD-endopeptidase MepM/ murein hydrolase activator NlpD
VIFVNFKLIYTFVKILINNSKMKKDIILAIVFSLIMLSFIDVFSKQNNLSKSMEGTGHEVKPPIMEYGLPVDSFMVEEKRIAAGTSFSVILNQLNIKSINTQSIIEHAAKVFDLRRIKQGNLYKVFYSKDSLKTVDYLVYEQNATDYILFNLKDSLQIEKRQKQVVSETQKASGTINSSLWAAVVENGHDPMLAMLLSDVYAWTVDFFGLQKGDQFKVFYETQTVEGKTIGIKKIHAAWFKHIEKEYYAIPFFQDSIISFFDEQGNSLRKAFLKAPLNYSRIASHFSKSRLHPILKIYRPHHGVDYSAPTGTPVQSIGDGVVILASYAGQAGHFVKIKHNSIYTTGYMHLSRYGEGIKPGKRVRQGEIIGYVGSTGLSTGPHLDFRVYKDGQPINPLKLESPPAKPVHEKDMKFFLKIKDIWKAELDMIQIIDNQNIANNDS